MGGCFSDEEINAQDYEDNEDGKTKIQMTKERRKFVKKTTTMLSVALPECKRIVNSKDETIMFKQIVHVLDQVVKHHLADLSAEERTQLLVMCVPPKETKFKEIVQQFTSSSKMRSSRTDVDLMKIVSLWFEADQDNSGELEFDEVRDLLFLMNVEISQTGLRDLIKMVDDSGDGNIQFDEFYKMYLLLTTVQSVSDIWKEAQTRPEFDEVLCLYDVERFLRAHQRMRFKPDEAERVVVNIFGELRLVDGVYGVAPRQFQNGLLDPKRNGWLDPRENFVHHDMTQPLNAYFIDSSHNTYLLGNQFSSQSSCEMYKHALLEGCRCVEIDCWDGPDDDPIVTHGGTMTTKIRFYDVIQTINRHAFERSPFPVILSLEIHTCAEQQNVMAEMMKSIFGTQLLTSADVESTTINSVGWTPAGLKRKILVKSKRYPPRPGTDEPPPESGAGAKLNALSFVQSKRYTSPQVAAKFSHFTIVSINEDRMEQWEKELDVFAQLNKTMLTRTYPRGSRVNSSNYNPQPGWNIGAQVVALNYQTMDFPMRLNRAKFTANGHSGYLLKPRCLRLKNVLPGTYGDRMKLTVEIICGVQLPRPVDSHSSEIIDPYVQVFITGIDGDDTSRFPKETMVIDNNGFNPVWREKFEFSLNSVEMAILTIRVMEKDTMTKDDFIGENSLPVSSLRLGYRAIALQYQSGELIPPPACLFCHFNLAPQAKLVNEEDI